MAFWGIEVKPGKPYNHTFDKTRGRLHVSQATLGIGSAAQRSVVQCNVGDKSPILLCSLLPDKIESCSLDLEFEEDDEVIFSVLGPRSVHLTGFYLGQGQGCCDDGDDTDSYGEDIGESESGSEEFDTEEEEYEEDFINDNDDDDDDDEDEDDELEMFPSARPNSGVVIEEIVDDEKPTNGNGNRKRLKKKYEISDSDDDDKKQIVVKGGNNFRVVESEDEDGFPISSQPESITTAKTNEGKSDKKIAKEKKKKKAAEEKSEKKIQTESKKKEEDGVDNGAGIKRKLDNITQDGEAERASEKSEDSSKTSTEIGQEKSEKPKKKKKVRAEGKTEGVGDDSKDVQKVENTQPEAKTKDEPKEKQPNDKSMEIDAGHATTDEEHSAKKKKKKKKNKSKESETNAPDEGKKGSVVEAEDKEAGAKSSKIRTFANGLVIEDVRMGKPDGKKASPGSKVSVRYIGKLKSNEKIFDSNVRGPPFKFRLGVGEVIKGWDIGVNGMRIGDKRRLTIPPAMGYGAKGAGKDIPPNAWLIFDVELVEVR